MITNMCLCQSQQINWIDSNSDKAELVSKLSDKPYLIYYKLDGCSACDKTNTYLEVYSSYINRFYYPIMVDCSNDEDCESIEYFPKIEFIEADGGNKITLEGLQVKEFVWSSLTQMP